MWSREITNGVPGNCKNRLNEVINFRVIFVVETCSDNPVHSCLNEDEHGQQNHESLDIDECILNQLNQTSNLTENGHEANHLERRDNHQEEIDQELKFVDIFVLLQSGKLDVDRFIEVGSSQTKLDEASDEIKCIQDV